MDQYPNRVAQLQVIGQDILEDRMLLTGIYTRLFAFFTTSSTILPRRSSAVDDIPLEMPVVKQDSAAYDYDDMSRSQRRSAKSRKCETL